MLSHVRVAALAAAMVVAGAVDASAETHYRQLYAFLGGHDGTLPMSDMVEVGGTLYGVTDSGGAGAASGTLFSVDPKTGAEKILHTFGAEGDGVFPQGGLINVDGVLYGTTTEGGQYRLGSWSCGTVFSFDIATGTYTIVHSFNGSDGMYPIAGLINVGDELYGTTQEGAYFDGKNCIVGCGSVFSIDRNTQAFTTMHEFKSGKGGNFPAGTLIQVKDKLYGTTQEGNGLHTGAIYSVNLHTSHEKTVLEFYGLEGPNQPYGGMVEVDGLLYGTTYHGGGGMGCYNGQFGCGTIFTVDPKTGDANVAYAFQGGHDGQFLRSNLINVGGMLYGTTSSGGTCRENRPAGCGTVFRFDPQTGKKVTIYTFKGGKDGSSPSAGLINVNGTLYGVTGGGGPANFGTVFAITP